MSEIAIKDESERTATVVCWQRVYTIPADVAAALAELRKDAERYRWLANRVLACDYGDNEAAGEQIGWRIRHDLLVRNGERQPAFMFGKSINAAIDAAIKEQTNE